MKIYLIHGVGIGSSYDRLMQIKKDYSALEVKEIEGRDINKHQLLMELGGGQLFTDRRLLIVNNLSLEVDLLELPDDVNLTLVLYFNKTVSAGTKVYKSAEILKAHIINNTEREEVLIFPFLDKLAEGDESCLQDWERLYKQYGSQYVITMIFYLLRKFILAPKKMPSFALNRYNKQKEKFSLDRIKKLYIDLIEIDFKIKSGLIDERMAIFLYIEGFFKVR